MNEIDDHYNGFLKEVEQIRNKQIETDRSRLHMDQLTEDVKQTFFNALLETVLFVKPEDSEATDLEPVFFDEMLVHSMSFLYRAWCFYVAENKQRTEDGKHLKTVGDLAHDFFMTACGDGVGFWEKSESDWLHCGNMLEKIANNYFYHGYSIMENEAGLLVGG